MFCPRCSQQQASEEMRFCSRCGFPLEGVAALLAGGGELKPSGPDREGPLTPRQRGARTGLLMVAGGLLFLAAAYLLTLYKEDFFVLMLPAALLVVVGVMRGLYGLLLESDAQSPKRLKTAKAADAATRELGGAAPAQTLPPASVADSTTRLLEEREPARQPAVRPRK